MCGSGWCPLTLSSLSLSLPMSKKGDAVCRDDDDDGRRRESAKERKSLSRSFSFSLAHVAWKMGRRRGIRVEKRAGSSLRPGRHGSRDDRGKPAGKRYFVCYSNRSRSRCRCRRRRRHHRQTSSSSSSSYSSLSLYIQVPENFTSIADCVCCYSCCCCSCSYTLLLLKSFFLSHSLTHSRFNIKRK